LLYWYNSTDTDTCGAAEWGLEGLSGAWKVREILGGKYRSFHAPDESVFFDLGEAQYFRCADY
jgi:hypothetical protein